MNGYKLYLSGVPYTLYVPHVANEERNMKTLTAGTATIVLPAKVEIIHFEIAGAGGKNISTGSYDSDYGYSGSTYSGGAGTLVTFDLDLTELNTLNAVITHVTGPVGSDSEINLVIGDNNLNVVSAHGFSSANGGASNHYNISGTMFDRIKNFSTVAGGGGAGGKIGWVAIDCRQQVNEIKSYRFAK